MNKFKKLVRTVCSALCASFLVTTVNADDIKKVIALKANELSEFIRNVDEETNEKTDDKLKNLVGDLNGVDDNIVEELRSPIFNRIFNKVVSNKIESNTSYLMPVDGNFLIVNKGGEEVGGLKKVESSDDCVICLGKFHDNEYDALLPCGHRFHMHCLNEWSKENMNCPMCRKSFGDNSIYIAQFRKQAEQNAQPNNELNNSRIEQNNEQDFNDQLNQIPVNEIGDPANENGENENNRVYDDQDFEFRILNVGNVYDFCRYVGTDSVSNIAQEMLFGNGLIDKKLENLSGEVVLNMHRKGIYVNGTCSLCNKSISPNNDEPAIVVDCNGDHCGIFHLGCLKYEAAKSHTNLRETLRKPGTLVFSGRNLDALKNSLNELRELLGM